MAIDCHNESGCDGTYMTPQLVVHWLHTVTLVGPTWRQQGGAAPGATVKWCPLGTVGHVRERVCRRV